MKHIKDKGFLCIKSLNCYKTPADVRTMVSHAVSEESKESPRFKDLFSSSSHISRQHWMPSSTPLSSKQHACKLLFFLLFGLSILFLSLSAFIIPRNLQMNLNLYLSSWHFTFDLIYHRNLKPNVSSAIKPFPESLSP